MFTTVNLIAYLTLLKSEFNGTRGRDECVSAIVHALMTMTVNADLQQVGFSYD
jgi:hypothetical protein